MTTKLALGTLLATIIVLAGCSTKPSLLHERASTGSSGNEIWVMDEVGKNAKFITKGSFPQWIWGGRTHFAYWMLDKSCDPNSFNHCGTLYVAEWDHKKQSMVGNPKAITGADSGQHFAWSRDGRWIVFESFRDGNWEIYKVRRDGTEAVNLTKNLSQDLQPDWTHNGSQNGKIAFVSNRTGHKDILVMNQNGGNVVNLTKDIPDMNNKPDGGNDWQPRWATNADSIAFLGTHQAWGNFSPNIYLTHVSSPGSLAVVSNLTGAKELLGWEGSESLFYASSKGVHRFDMKSNKENMITSQYNLAGDQYAIGAQFIFAGTNKGIKAIEWHYINRVHDVGPGINPDN